MEEIYYEAKSDKWMKGFAVFCRIALAVSFIPSGLVKIMGERFAEGLSSNNPLGHYFDALYLTGYYYTFIGIAQVVIGILLLIPRTSLLGALMYFPLILNICVLTYATRFAGTRLNTMMLLASLFLLIWNYDRLKYILPFKQPP
ncbi:MauE/DoxX family redox-associated membrane protein [Paraflavitalea speifideaquila]|uniref:MauE/DoxX family redox-associated membrane protein n=1 Tax=Paraflavitalea speifideaquila TaxID=3076558 RepID=UPI0028EC2963|nr:MauE/DoxX family redox-associated membrane protein [Paraflavitalea speifideiaquila]